jgi:ATP-binding cassette, subfamily B, bacterial
MPETAEAGRSRGTRSEDRWLLFRLRRALWGEMFRTSRVLTVLVVVSIVVGALLSGAFIVATGVLVGAVPEAVRSGLESDAGRTLLTGVVVLATLYILQMAVTPLRGAVCDVLGRRLEGRMRERVMKAVLAPPGVAHLERPEVQDRISVAQEVGIGEVRPRRTVLAVVGKYSQQLQGLVSAALLFPFAWWAPLVVGGAWLLLRRVWVRRMRDSVELNALQTRSLRRSGYFRDLAMTAPAAKETRIFGMESWLVDRFVRHWLEAMSRVWQERRRSSPLLWGSVAVLVGVYLGLLLLLARSAVTGQITLAALVIYVQAAFGVEGVASYDADHRIDSGSRPLLGVRELERELAGPEFRMTGDEPVGGLPHTAVRFDGVRFRYPGNATEVFDGLDLEIPAGQSLAIVGDNGAGKTTLVKLLARLYDPDDGRITVDGVDLRRLDPGRWARRVAAIFQDFVRYHLAVADNVGFGALELADDRRALGEAVRRAGAEETVRKLPHGWDTVLSREFALGSDLSGGEWQRIALARALLAVDGGAGILILDEPTAHLDARAEAEFYERFLDLTRGHTTIVISHRFSTVRQADRIVVLSGGRVVEQGSHDELVAAGGHYARMFAVQAARFADRPQTAGVE